MALKDLSDDEKQKVIGALEVTVKIFNEDALLDILVKLGEIESLRDLDIASDDAKKLQGVIQQMQSEIREKISVSELSQPWLKEALNELLKEASKG